jgi:hypothetical protein
MGNLASGPGLGRLRVRRKAHPMSVALGPSTELRTQLRRPVSHAVRRLGTWDMGHGTDSPPTANRRQHLYKYKYKTTASFAPIGWPSYTRRCMQDKRGCKGGRVGTRYSMYSTVIHTRRVCCTLPKRTASQLAVQYTRPSMRRRPLHREALCFVDTPARRHLKTYKRRAVKLHRTYSALETLQSTSQTLYL